MTAEIGAMRISEEIDATEALGLRPIPFVVGTRLVGAMICVVPGFLMTLVVSFFVSNTVIRVFHDQPGGTYDHYFVQFLPLTDIVYSLIKATIFCIAVTLIHCYYGYFTTGGPVGVGLASGARGASEPGRDHGSGLHPHGGVVGPSASVRLQGIGDSRC